MEKSKKHTVLKLALYLFSLLSIGVHTISLIDSIQTVMNLKKLEENKHGEE